MSYRDDSVPIRHMLEHVRHALDYASSYDTATPAERHIADLALQHTVSVMGDAARRVAEPTRRRHPSVPWDALIREGDRVRTEYDRVDSNALRQAVFERFSPLVALLEDALRVEAARADSRPPPARASRGPAIEVPRATLAEFCRRHGIRRLALFGSVLRDDFAPTSDVDVLVEFEPGHTPGFGFFRLQEDLTSILGRDVDLVTRNALSPYLRDRVLAQAEDVFVAA